MSEPAKSLLVCDLLDDYLTSELPADRRNEFESHLDACYSCRNAVHAWDVLCGTLKGATSELEAPSPSLIERIESARRARTPRDLREAQKWRVPVLLGASLVAAALFAVFLRPPPLPPDVAKALPTTKPPTRTPLPRAKVEFPQDVIGEPIDIGDPNVTVVWVYPTVNSTNQTN